MLIPRLLTRTVRPVAGVLLLAFALVSSADCLIGSRSIHEKMACCAAMADSCGSAATIEKDCCAVQQPGQTGPVSMMFAATPPASLISAVLPSAPVSVVRHDPGLSNPVSPPAYLLDSVFRI